MLLKNLFKERGVDFREYRPKCIGRRIATRLRVTGAKNYLEYLSILREEPEEYDKLLNVCTVQSKMKHPRSQMC
ncbi:MAG: hypothetical protein HYT97_07270 [Elusimicrobia bacterium]|nr:hypothetical protein [Elusimicrobiota bacterium]